ncbi:MAG: hypothetical protein RIC56_02310 [Pseudomonadales bacterium]
MNAGNRVGAPLTPAPAGDRAWLTRATRGYLTVAGYLLVGAVIVTAWSVRHDNLITAEAGLGYLLGIVGTTLMGLLLLYPARKRMRALQRLGPTSVWFRVHMVFGIVGPLLIILHSNFNLGSFNGRVALFCTLVVAGSGIVGRYIYAKLHYGLYGRKASLAGLRNDVEAMRDGQSAMSSMLPTLTEDLASLEDRLLNDQPGLVGAFGRAITIVPHGAYLRWTLKRQAGQRIRALAASSPVIAAHEKRLRSNARRYIEARLRALRKFAQFRAFETLFSLWHVVHYPLFLILVLAVIVHVLAVHMY